MTLLLFQLLPSRRAIIWSLLSAFMLLPVGAGFDAPGIPRMDKTLIPNVSMLICALMFARHRVIALPKSKIVVVLLALYIFSPFLTTINNRDPLILSVSALPGMTLYDGTSLAIRQFIQIIPFLVGYAALSRIEDAREILIALVVAGLAYSVPMLWEVRMSPQLHTQLYGYISHDFIQQIRAGGYRPMVFMGHGLVVAIFTAMATVAAAGLWRQKERINGFKGGSYTGYLFVMLLICKSLGALLLTMVIAPLALFARKRRLATILSIAGLIIISYPALRGAGLVPVHTITNFVSDLSEERSNSLLIRIVNEDQLLEKASHRPFFGWGSWGRSRIFKSSWQGDYDSTTSDGVWVIVIGTFGWVGYIACFGLLAYPCLRAFQHRKELSLYPPFIALLAVLVTNLFDLIPNSSLISMTWLIAGALAGIRFSPNRPTTLCAQEAEPAG